MKPLPLITATILFSAAFVSAQREPEPSPPVVEAQPVIETVEPTKPGPELADPEVKYPSPLDKPEQPRCCGCTKCTGKPGCNCVCPNCKCNHSPAAAYSAHLKICPQCSNRDLPHCAIGIKLLDASTPFVDKIERPIPTWTDGDFAEYSAARKLQKETGKYLVIDFCPVTCIPCQKLKPFLESPAVMKSLDGCILLRVGDGELLSKFTFTNPPKKTVPRIAIVAPGPDRKFYDFIPTERNFFAEVNRVREGWK